MRAQIKNALGLELCSHADIRNSVPELQPGHDPRVQRVFAVGTALFQVGTACYIVIEPGGFP